MDAKERLEKLSVVVALERRKGFVQKWPDDIKKEAVYLSNIYGLRKVHLATNLHVPSLCIWRKNQQNKERMLSREVTSDKILVTRIIARESGSQFQEQKPIASIMKDKIEFRIFCRDVAEKIAKSFFL